MLATMVVMGVVGVLIERVAYRPLRNAPRLAPLITAIGVSFILQNIIATASATRSSTSRRSCRTDKFAIIGAKIRLDQPVHRDLAVVLMIALQLFIARTRLGRAMRSTASDREAAQLMGVDINQTIALTFFIGVGPGGRGGRGPGPVLRRDRSSTSGFQAGLKAFTAAVLGGIGNTTGAALGGFVIGFLEVISTVFGYGRWSEAVVFAVAGPGPDLPADAASSASSSVIAHDSHLARTRTPDPPGSASGAPRAATSRSRSSSAWVVIAIALPLIVAAAAVQRRSSRRRTGIGSFADAGVFVLLAIGLNVVVGLAGLLDLGYAAFFAIGAYTYAYGASRLHRPRDPLLDHAARRRRGRGHASASCWAHRRCACAATTWRS